MCWYAILNNTTVQILEFFMGFFGPLFASVCHIEYCTLQKQWATYEIILFLPKLWDKSPKVKILFAYSKEFENCF